MCMFLLNEKLVSQAITIYQHKETVGSLLSIMWKWSDACLNQE